MFARHQIEAFRGAGTGEYRTACGQSLTDLDPRPSADFQRCDERLGSSQEGPDIRDVLFQFDPVSKQVQNARIGPRTHNLQVQAGVPGARRVELRHEALQGTDVGFIVQASKEEQPARDRLASVGLELVGVGAAGNDVGSDVLVTLGQPLCILVATDNVVLCARASCLLQLPPARADRSLLAECLGMVYIELVVVNHQGQGKLWR